MTFAILFLATAAATVPDGAAALALLALALVGSAIEWTNETWNPVTGCTRVSRGCDLCYAVKITLWLAGLGQEKYQGLVNPGKGHFNGVLKVHVSELEKPLRWRKPRRIFVNSMSDLFHPNVPDWFIVAVFKVMRLAPQHQFQICTKRPGRALQMERDGLITWPENVWLGVSVEDADVLDRVDVLRQIGAAVRFLSCEPLLGPLTGLDLTGIHWVITGGESGGEARPMDYDWARAVRDLCVSHGVAYFHKQNGVFSEDGKRVGKKKAGRELDGRTWDEYPRDLES